LFATIIALCFAGCPEVWAIRQSHHLSSAADDLNYSDWFSFHVSLEYPDGADMQKLRLMNPMHFNMEDYSISVLASLKAVVGNRANLALDVDIEDQEKFVHHVQGGFILREVSAVESLLDTLGLKNKAEYIKERVAESAKHAAKKAIAHQLETLLQSQQGVTAKASVSNEPDLAVDPADLSFDRTFIFWVTLRDRESLSQLVKKPAAKAAVRHLSAGKLLKLVEEMIMAEIPQALDAQNLTSALNVSVTSDADIDGGVTTEPLSFWLRIKVEHLSVVQLLEATKGSATMQAFSKVLDKLRRLHGFGIQHIDRAVEGIQEGVDKKALLLIKEKLAELVSKILGQATPVSGEAYQALRDYVGAVPGRCCGDRSDAQKVRARWVSEDLLLGSGAGHSMLGRWGHCPRLDFNKDCADDSRWRSTPNTHLEQTHHLASRECFRQFLDASAHQESEEAELRDYSALLDHVDSPTTKSCHSA